MCTVKLTKSILLKINQNIISESKDNSGKRRKSFQLILVYSNFSFFFLLFEVCVLLIWMWNEWLLYEKVLFYLFWNLELMNGWFRIKINLFFVNGLNGPLDSTINWFLFTLARNFLWFVEIDPKINFIVRPLSLNIL